MGTTPQLMTVLVWRDEPDAVSQYPGCFKLEIRMSARGSERGREGGREGRETDERREKQEKGGGRKEWMSDTPNFDIQIS